MRYRKSARRRKSVKFMQVLDQKIFTKLGKIARQRGVTLQELLRVQVIADWLQAYRQGERERQRRRRARRR